MAPADRPVFVLLQEAQQHDLRARRHRLDLVEKQRAALGLRDQAAARALGVGERAALMAEQLAFQKIVRQRAAVDRNERKIAARAQVMQRARGQLLAGPGLALHQNGGVDCRDALDDAQRVQEDRGFAQQIQLRECIARQGALRNVDPSHDKRPRRTTSDEFRFRDRHRGSAR